MAKNIEKQGAKCSGKLTLIFSCVRRSDAQNLVDAVHPSRSHFFSSQLPLWHHFAQNTTTKNFLLFSKTFSLLRIGICLFVSNFSFLQKLFCLSTTLFLKNFSKLPNLSIENVLWQCWSPANCRLQTTARPFRKAPSRVSTLPLPGQPITERRERTPNSNNRRQIGPTFLPNPVIYITSYNQN